MELGEWDEIMRRAYIDLGEEIIWLLKYLAKLGWIELSLHSSGAISPCRSKE